MKLSRAASIFALLACQCVCANAANFSILSKSDDTSSAEVEVVSSTLHIELKGDIDNGDLAKLKSIFTQETTRLERSPGCPKNKCEVVKLEVTLSLSSNGGLFSEGLKIAEFVADQKVKTLIPANESCFSSCGLIFLAGQYDDSGENPDSSKVGPKRKLYPSSKLGLHAPYLDIEEQSYSKQIVETAYELAVQNIADIVRISKKSNLDTSLLPIFLGKTRNEMYVVDTAEKAVRFNVPVDLTSYVPKNITPAMAKNYCLYLVSSKDGKFASESFPSSGRVIIGNPRTIINGPKPHNETDDKVVFQARTEKVQTAAGKLDKTVIALPMFRYNVEEATSATICIADWYVWPDRKDDDPARIIFDACLLDVSLKDDLDSTIKPSAILSQAWLEYSKMKKSNGDGCTDGRNLSDWEGETRAPLFAPPDTPLNSIPQTLQRLDKPAPSTPALPAVSTKQATAQFLPVTIRTSVQNTLKDCDDPKAEIRPAAIKMLDLNGDGVNDFVVDYSKIAGCSGFCGSAGCTHDFWISSQGIHVRALSFNIQQVMRVERTANGNALTLGMHGSQCKQVGSKPCYFQLTWNGRKPIITPLPNGVASQPSTRR